MTKKKQKKNRNVIEINTPLSSCPFTVIIDEASDVNAEIWLMKGNKIIEKVRGKLA